MFICICQTDFAEMSAQIVAKLQVAGANLKIPSFLEGLGRLPDYRWDIFYEVALLEVLL